MTGEVFQWMQSMRTNPRKRKQTGGRPRNPLRDQGEALLRAGGKPRVIAEDLGVGLALVYLWRKELQDV